MGRDEILTQSIPVSQARQKLGELVNEVYKRHVRVVVEKSGIPVVAVVSLADFERWVRLDRERDLADPNNEELAMQREADNAKSPTRAELARRQEAIARILANADKRVIAPLTSTELVQQSREERQEAYERWTR